MKWSNLQFPCKSCNTKQRIWRNLQTGNICYKIAILPESFDQLLMVLPDDIYAHQSCLSSLPPLLLPQTHGEKCYANTQELPVLQTLTVPLVLEQHSLRQRDTIFTGHHLLLLLFIISCVYGFNKSIQTSKASVIITIFLSPKIILAVQTRVSFGNSQNVSAEV